MLICKDCICYHPISVSDRYCGECCIGDTRNPIAINADTTGCCLFEPKHQKQKSKKRRFRIIDDCGWEHIVETDRPDLMAANIVLLVPHVRSAAEITDTEEDTA